MQVQIRKEISKRILKASKTLGVKGDELVDRAILLYLDNLSKYLKLKEELSIWEKASNIDLINFEKSLR